MLSFFPLDVLDEIWDVIESVSEGFLTYSFMSDSTDQATDTRLATINEIVGSVVLGLTNALDLVSYHNLLRKLASYMFSPLTLVWLDSYLSNRNQQVHVSGKLSYERR